MRRFLLAAAFTLIPAAAFAQANDNMPAPSNPAPVAQPSAAGNTQPRAGAPATRTHASRQHATPEQNGRSAATQTPRRRVARTRTPRPARATQPQPGGSQ